jgi:hypothetical protein
MVVSLHYQVLGAIGISIERWTSGSSYLRPIGRLIEKMVFSGLVTACGLATWLTTLGNCNNGRGQRNGSKHINVICAYTSFVKRQ